jgi:class 3 adenylate cyclase
VLAYFGYPVAHEDDAQRAVRTGLGLLDALEPLTTRLALPPGEQVAVRLAVHTGVAVVGDGGAGARYEPLALGETPNIAARIYCHEAEKRTEERGAHRNGLPLRVARCGSFTKAAIRGPRRPGDS